MDRKQALILFLILASLTFFAFSDVIHNAKLIGSIVGDTDAFVSVDSIDVTHIATKYLNSDNVIIVKDGGTIQEAVDSVVAAADNADENAYVILVPPGEYTETIDLDSKELFNLSIVSMFGKHTTFINPSSGNAVETDTNNTNLHYLYFKGFTFKDDISLSGAIDSTKFLYEEGTFDDCIFHDDATEIKITNAGHFTWRNGGIHVLNTIDLDNVYTFSIEGEEYWDIFPITGAPGETELTVNTANNCPYDYYDSDASLSFEVMDAYVQRKEPAITVTAGTVKYRLYRAYFGLATGLTIPSGAELYCYNAVLPGDVSASAGSVVWLYNTCVRDAYTSSSTDSHYYGSTEGTGLNAIAD